MKISILIGIMLAAPLAAFSADAGDAELKILEDLVTGNIGLAIGLILAVWGLWKAVVSGETGSGLLLLVCGVLLTLFPGVFDTAASIVKPIAQTLTGG